MFFKRASNTNSGMKNGGNSDVITQYYIMYV